VNKELKELATAPVEDREAKMNDIERRVKEGTLIDALRGVTHIVRTGDSGPHFHARANLEWESSVWSTYGIRWETHTLCKRHAWSECDAHGGAGKRAMKAAAVKGCAPGEAEEYATIVNNCTTGFSNCKAYALRNINRSEKEALLKELKELPGMKQMCEFQYFYLDEKNEVVRRPGIVLMRACSGNVRFTYINRKREEIPDLRA